MRHPDPFRISQARAVIDPAFLNLPIRRSDAVDDALGASLLVKDETANPIRCFKGRGASNFVSQIGGGEHIVCASAGNFGQAMAWAAVRRKIPITVYASRNAVARKLQRMRELGAEVILAGEDFDEAKEAARTFARAAGSLFVEDGAHVEIAEGAGTIACELTDRADAFDTLLLPLGNGALAAGVGAWMKHARPDVEVIAVGAAKAPAMAEAVMTGVAEERSTATIADGIAVRVPIPYAVESVRRVVDEVLLVEEPSIRSAMRLLSGALGTDVEPSAAVPIAALLDAPQRWRGRRVASVLTGGNVDPGASS